MQFCSEQAKGGVYSMDVKAAAGAPNLTLRDIINKLDELHGRRIIRLAASGLENRYQVMSIKLPRTPGEIDTLAGEIFATLKQYEADAVQRVDQVIGVVTGEQCFSYALASYFGMGLPGSKKRCGHCSWCETGVAVVMPEALPRDPVDLDLIMEILNTIPDRDDLLLLTKIAFGITSPRIMRMRANRNHVFGSLVGHDFGAVLDEFTKVCSQEGGKGSTVKREPSTLAIKKEPMSSAQSG
ncbi:hypothetical protein GGTG_13502 [Gaeumannomyces tritici R3-111a-1]|uniref:ATP-dependent DNA helicase RecQ zinc-binding domain-containing protein n=1 Tax=Gaeumannomyces tritici (strain R3-111a-1) TaxID=644352 RepID=J3PJ20_GAET3|nr:hypothetical protein GGTG_13502 [Gaeumannomyces tritici R3-111a-1]EJT68909.1 hypothetical protein GGTG_13502 [Gaeumannomyces tritici R3-111a-1]